MFQAGIEIRLNLLQSKSLPYIYIYIYHHHHHVLVARISLTLSHHFSLSFIASGRSSRLHPVSPHSCWMYIRAGRPAFARPYVGVHKSTSLMNSSLQICIAEYLKESYVVTGRCKWKEKRQKKLNRKYFIIDDTRALSSGDSSSDKTRGCLKVKNINDNE